MILLLVVALAGQTLTGQPAVPVQATAAIVDAFRTHSVVAVTAGHGEERGYAFLVSLIRDPRFVKVVNDIVIEEGNSHYQDVADRFVRGEIVAPESLRAIWRDNTQPGLSADEPWEQIFTAVRLVNASLGKARQIRIVLGDPPIDWKNVSTTADHRRWIEMRETVPVELIQREVLAKRRRALVTYGQMHFQRKQILANYESEGAAETLVSRLEKLTGIKVFTIFTFTEIAKLQPSVAAWPVPSIAKVRGTLLGEADLALYFPSMQQRYAIRDGKVTPIPRDQWRTLRAEDQFDAVLYPGLEPSRTIRVSRSQCLDSVGMDMIFRRMAIAALPQAVMDRVKQDCDAITVK
jgi:hypothetical protein